MLIYLKKTSEERKINIMEPLATMLPNCIINSSTLEHIMFHSPVAAKRSDRWAYSALLHDVSVSAFDFFQV